MMYVNVLWNFQCQWFLHNKMNLFLVAVSVKKKHCIPKCSTMHNRSYNFVLCDQWMSCIFARRLHLISCLKREIYMKFWTKRFADMMINQLALM
jgi:hypothetical protein